MPRKVSSKKHSIVPPTKSPASGRRAAKPKSVTEVEPVKSPAAVVAQPAVAGKPAVNEKTESLITALRDSDADVASSAAAALGQLGDPAAVTPLIDVIDNANGYFHSVVRAAAASSLAQLGDARAVESLLHAIRDPMAEASAEAVRALATLGDRRAVGPLIEVVRNSSGFYLHIVRRAAVLALAKLGGDEARAELRTVANNAWEDQVVRDAAIQAVR